MADTPTAQAGPARACTICGRPQVAAYRPFCSAHCANVDLHRWLGEGYAIPAADPDLEDEDPAPPRRPGTA